ncbi:hypothetical protein [Magnetococcus marinus]|uniref:hypothetical protein n=1 Tax=Magnetococcus marinus TaxID=1124597 RepID=UPI0005A0488D|nr:hypothetical protein [Magnetococcus marinus]
MNLSDKTTAILKKALKMGNLSEVANKPYKDLPDKISYQELASYASKGRGSVRLATGRFFSPEESKAWADKVRHLNLP